MESEFFGSAVQPQSASAHTLLTSEPTIFVINADGQIAPELAAHISASGLRLLGSASFSNAAAALSRIARVRMVWIDYDIMVDDALAARLTTMAEMDVVQLVVVTGGANLDAAFAHFASAPHVLLCDPAPVDMLLTLYSAWDSQTISVHDILQEPASTELARLYDEVARISQMLMRMSQTEANTLSGGIGEHAGIGHKGSNYGEFGRSQFPATPVSPFIDDHVASPSRTYRGQPPLNQAGLPEPARYAPSQRAEAVRRMIRARRLREQFFTGDLFADPAWDMLLDLYAAKLERAQVSVSSLCIAAAVPATTALRWIKSMSDAGLFVREADPHDGRRVFIALGDGAKDALDRYFAMLDREAMGVI